MKWQSSMMLSLYLYRMFYHPSSDVIADDITPSLCCAHPDIICYVLRGALASQALSVTGAKSYSIEESL